MSPKTAAKRPARHANHSGGVKLQGHLSRQGAAQLLLLSELFFLEGHTDDLLHGVGEEDGVCWGEDLGRIDN